MTNDKKTNDMKTNDMKKNDVAHRRSPRAGGVVVAAMLAAALVLATGVATAAAQSGSYDTECTNSATPDTTELTWNITATAPASAAVGDSVVLGGQQWEVTIPGSVFDTGINLNLITPGQEVSALVDPEIIASNTAEGSAIAEDLAITLVVDVDDAGAALDATASFAAPDLTFTATGIPVDFSVGKLAMDVDIGLPIAIVFTCEPTAGQAAFISVGEGGGADSGTQDTGTPELAATGLDASTWVLVAAGLLLLDLGYMAKSATRPHGLRRRG